MMCGGLYQMDDDYIPKRWSTIRPCKKDTMRGSRPGLVKDPSYAPFGIGYWLATDWLKKKKTPLQRFVNYCSKFFRTTLKELRPMTKKKLRTEIENLKRQVTIERNDAEGWRKSFKKCDKKYTALQQAVCDLTKKADLDITQERVCVPGGGW